MKRWEWSGVFRMMISSTEGEWVRYEDVETEIKLLKQSREDWRELAHKYARECDELESQLTVEMRNR